MISLSFLVFFYFLMSLYSLFHKAEFKVHMSYYPKEIRCIDQLLKGHGHYGIAQYWNANVITSLSKAHLQVVPFNPNLTPFYWSINIKKFEKPISFIIVDKRDIRSLHKNEIYAKYSVPQKEVTCYSRKVLIYPRESIKGTSPPPNFKIFS